MTNMAPSSSPALPVLLLGTGSPRRHRIMSEVAIPFEVFHPEMDEFHDDWDGVRTASVNALAKHACCRNRFPGRWILTADTIVEFNGRCLGKPRDPAHATEMLLSFSGKVQHVFTAVALSAPDSEAPDLRVAGSSVRFLTLSRTDVAAYLEAAKPWDRAGAYDIDTHGERILSGFFGSYTNIMGLPAETVLDWLRAHAYPVPSGGRVPTPPAGWFGKELPL